MNARPSDQEGRGCEADQFARPRTCPCLRFQTRTCAFPRENVHVRVRHASELDHTLSVFTEMCASGSSTCTCTSLAHVHVHVHAPQNRRHLHTPLLQSDRILRHDEHATSNTGTCEQHTSVCARTAHTYTTRGGRVVQAHRSASTGARRGQGAHERQTRSAHCATCT